eukprot:GHRR01001261.1.p1 GENE.GHRR01001261.1~~GHRR01001261.1.p1  ORF type:complete len:688 (+),score=-116.60 GHRR01001261.1:495-2558(+)
MLFAHFPLMTNRGHFVLNGSARVIINQLVRSPGIYFRKNFHEIYSSKWSEKPSTTFCRFYADIICLKGTWLRLECDKDFSMWAKTKKGPKIPLLWFLLGMGLGEKYILNSVSKPMYLFESFTKEIEKLRQSNSRFFGNTDQKNSTRSSQLKSQVQKAKSLQQPKTNLSIRASQLKTGRRQQTTKQLKYAYVSSPQQAWEQIQQLFKLKKTLRKSSVFTVDKSTSTSYDMDKRNNSIQKHSPFVGQVFTGNLRVPLQSAQSNSTHMKSFAESLASTNSGQVQTQQKNLSALRASVVDKRTGKKFKAYELGRKWFSNKFMNPRTYDLGKQGRWSINKKLGLTLPIQQTTLTALDVLTATDSLMRIEDGFLEVDDIDHLKNKKLRTAGECVQEIFSIGLIRLEKSIRLKLNDVRQSLPQKSSLGRRFGSKQSSHQNHLNFHSLINTRPINGAFREFFGTHPLSQFMDQINPLAEITHKRRLTSLGPGGVSRDTATLAIRGIHPSHYGRICPIETPEGKNTGLVNSITTFAKISPEGFLCSPFYKVYKGQVQKNLGVFFLGPAEEEHFQTATPDLNLTSLGFLPNSPIPVRLGKRFVRMKSQKLALMGVSPLQMISVATSFIPFLEHDDANRALMGSNMQRQAVPLLKPERPFIGTGLEARVVSDSGHALTSKTSGYVFYSSGSKIYVYTF